MRRMRNAGLRPADPATSCRRSAAGGRRSSRLEAGVAITLLVFTLACAREKPASDASRGKEAIGKYGCAACHNIPGIDGPRGMVGPPLDHWKGRNYIAGKFPNTPETMIKWIQNPQAMDPNNAMPNLGVTPDDARDIAAYLYTLQ